MSLAWLFNMLGHFTMSSILLWVTSYQTKKSSFVWHMMNVASYTSSNECNEMLHTSFSLAQVGNVMFSSPERRFMKTVS